MTELGGEVGGRLRSLPAVEMTKAGEGRDDSMGGEVGGRLRSLPLVEMTKGGDGRDGKTMGSQIVE